MTSAKDFFLILASISFMLIIGAAVYEHLAVVPSWTAAPPASLEMFSVEYPLESGHFWMPIHPVTVLLLIIALIVNWNTARKKNIFFVLLGYVAILALTFVYFVPVLMEFITMPPQDRVDQALTEKASTWELLSLIRLVFLFVLAYFLLKTLTISNATTREIVRA